MDRLAGLHPPFDDPALVPGRDPRALRHTRPIRMSTSLIMMLLDGAAMLAIWPVGMMAALGRPWPVSDAQLTVIAVSYPLTQFVLLYALGMYRRDTLIEIRKSLRRIPLVAALGAVGGAILAALLGWWLTASPGLSSSPGRVLIVAFACQLTSGVIARGVFRLLRHWGVIHRRLLVVGAGHRAWDLAWMLRAEGRNLSYQLMFAHMPALGDIDPRLATGAEGEIIPAFEFGLLRTAQAYRIDEIVVGPDDRRGMTMIDLLACKTAGYPIKQYLSFLENETHRVDLKRMEIGWLLYSDGFYFGVLDRAVKRALDLAVSVLLLVPAMPLLLLAMAAIKLDDGGPVFYHQTRLTRGNREFSIAKLRTMRVDAEAGGAVWAAMRDSRITRIGTFLRRTRIDELPQLFNVLRGDMSLVGPRPERPGFVDVLAKEIPLYKERHLVKAGLTGWAQINYPYGASVDDARSKLSYDLYYVKNFSMLLDFMIILQTLRVLLWPGNSVR